MKKILLIIPFLIGGITIAQAQSCSVNECGEDPNRACKTGGFASCERLASPIPNGNSQGCAWLCLEDPRLAGINTNQSNNQKDDKPKTCLKGETLKNGECKPDCIETLKPNTSLTSQDMYAWWMSRQTQHQRAYPLAAGTTASSFRAGAGILPGDQQVCKHTPKYDAFAKCLNENDPQGKNGIWLSGEKLDIASHEEAKSCAVKNGYGNPQNPELALQNANKDYSCLKGSVFDALWGFLTHRKPY